MLVLYVFLYLIVGLLFIGSLRALEKATLRKTDIADSPPGMLGFCVVIWPVFLLSNIITLMIKLLVLVLRFLGKFVQGFSGHDKSS